MENLTLYFISEVLERFCTFLLSEPICYFVYLFLLVCILEVFFRLISIRRY